MYSIYFFISCMTRTHHGFKFVFMIGMKKVEEGKMIFVATTVVKFYVRLGRMTFSKPPVIYYS